MQKKDNVVTLFTSDHCEPCEEVKELVEKGRFESDFSEESSVDLVDIESEEGFAKLAEVADKITKVPMALHKGKACAISIDREFGIVVFSCEEEGNPEPKDQSKDS